ncbi:MAG: RluA family pseudouridine synthase [Planctomycetota bacterium]|nr:RluA family pseudouridine synthase [Planctomycetota bacterium]
MDSASLVQVLREERDLLLVYKPPGIETCSEFGEADLTGAVRRLRPDPEPCPAHRLDRNTSGVQLYARGPAMLARLTQLFRERRVEKSYLGLCLGVPWNREGRLNRRLSEWEGGRRPVRVVKGTGREKGLTAETLYTLLLATPPGGEFTASLLRFHPRQGRTHQVRVHAAAFGHPLLGDDQYGDRPANRWAAAELGLRRQALHAEALAFPWEGGRVEVVSFLPPDLQTAVARLFPGASYPPPSLFPGPGGGAEGREG